jgi:hypothetical protein
VKFTINTKELIKLLERSLLKGKYATSGEMKNDMLSDYARIVTGDNLVIFNADNSTLLKLEVECQIEETGQVVVEITNLIQYLKSMGQVTTFSANETITLHSDTKHAQLPIVVVHPNISTIEMLGKKDISFDAEIQEFLTYGKSNKEYTSVIQIESNLLVDAIKSCELVKSGIYTLNFFDDFTINSQKNINAYTQLLPILQSKGDPATVSVSAPIHALFQNEIINIYMSDDVPITIVSPTAFLIRAPRVSGD